MAKRKGYHSSYPPFVYTLHRLSFISKSKVDVKYSIFTASSIKIEFNLFTGVYWPTCGAATAKVSCKFNGFTKQASTNIKANETALYVQKVDVHKDLPQLSSNVNSNISSKQKFRNSLIPLINRTHANTLYIAANT